MRFTGKTALVTGSTRGIGEATARLLASEGAHTIVHGRSLDVAQAVAQSICAQGASASACAFELGSSDSVRAGLAKIFEQHSVLDIVVNNAAMVSDGALVMMSDHDWDEVINVNLSGCFRVCRAVSRAMLSRRSGAIINVGSIGGMRSSPGQSNYSASKAGLVGFSRTMARELAPRGVRVNCVIPGVIDSGMTLRTNRRRVDEVVAHVPCKRRGTAMEVAQAVAFLASDAASYIYGAELVVDGGLCL